MLLKVFLHRLFVILSFIIFKILGPNLSSSISGKIFELIGPNFRSKEVVKSNIKKAFPNINSSDRQRISNSMWKNYGKVFAEFMFMKILDLENLQKKLKLRVRKY